jgi:DNA-binding HxlR family transcriptional regulator
MPAEENAAAPGVKGALSLALEQAVLDGLVTVTRHPTDPEQDHFKLTPKGEQYVADQTNNQKYEER